MDRRMRFWVVALIVKLCMSVTVTKSNGARPLHNQLQEEIGVKWAFLVAGSRGYGNYRHQADICHAFQVLKSGGLKDENIIVMMYDDIADNIENPTPGSLINELDGPDVYHGVPKDYTTMEANIFNFYAVLRGDKNGLLGGTGKVLNSKPEDTVFIYISSHGNVGVIALPDDTLIYADQFIEALKKINYKKMVIYIETCNSGSMFEGLLRDDLNIYATTSARPDENSHAFYCPRGIMPPPPNYTTCLGDLYSISWLEFSDQYDRKNKTLLQQYDTVWFRTLFTHDEYSSHVMPYGNLTMQNDVLDTYLGAKPIVANDNYHFNKTTTHEHSNKRFNTTAKLISQQDAHLLYLNLKLEKAPHGSMDKLKAQSELDDEISHRKHDDHSVSLIWKLLFGETSTMMANLRSVGQPLVDDWDCLRMLKNTYEHHCGVLSHYGLKYMQAFANMCNDGISMKQMIEASSQACPVKNDVP